MKPELNLKQLETILAEVSTVQEQHPKANVVYDTERHQILVTYPVPRDLWDIKDMKIAPNKTN